MGKGIAGTTGITIGLDVSDRFTEAYAIDANGEFVASWQLRGEGFEVIVAHPRRVRLIAESDSKCDRLDAEHLVRLGRIDAKLLSPRSSR